MSPIPESAIISAGAEITIEAELLAPKLGLMANTVTKGRYLKTEQISMTEHMLGHSNR